MARNNNYHIFSFGSAIWALPTSFNGTRAPSIHLSCLVLYIIVEAFLFPGQRFGLLFLRHSSEILFQILKKTEIFMIPLLLLVGF